MIDQEFEFHEIVARVEERFRPMLDKEAAEQLGGTEKQQGKYEPKQVSTGWWVVLARFGVAVRFGTMKPDIAPGDTLVLTARKIPKPPEPEEQPAPIDAPDLRKSLKELRAGAPDEVAAKLDEAIAALGPEPVS